jgi:hypothetical protein
LTASSKEPIDERDVEEGDWRGLSIGEVAAVEGEDSAAIAAAVRRRCAFDSTAVVAIVIDDYV